MTTTEKENQEDIIRILWVLEGLKDKTEWQELPYLQEAIDTLSRVSGLDWGK